MSKTISNTDNVIDSRDVIERIDELKDEFEAAHEEYKEKIEEEYEDYKADFEGEYGEEPLDFKTWLDYSQLSVLDFDDWLTSEFCELDRDDIDEYTALVALQEECEGYSDWKYGVCLVHENYFVKYCEDMLEDIGDIPKNIPSYIEINWEATSENIKADYSEADFGGETYYFR